MIVHDSKLLKEYVLCVLKVHKASVAAMRQVLDDQLEDVHEKVLGFRVQGFWVSGFRVGFGIFWTI